MTGVFVAKMKDVAELAGVSNAAVSRYLNGGYISADKAERIKRAIEQTGYVRSNQARALRTGSTKLIGVIVPKINSESVSRITAGIGQVLGRRGRVVNEQQAALGVGGDETGQLGDRAGGPAVEQRVREFGEPGHLADYEPTQLQEPRL